MLALIFNGIVVDETHLGRDAAQGVLRRLRIFNA